MEKLDRLANREIKKNVQMCKESVSKMSEMF